MPNTRFVVVKLSPDRHRLEIEGDVASAVQATDMMHSFYRILTGLVELANVQVHGPDRLLALKQAVQQVEALCEELLEPDPDAE